MAGLNNEKIIKTAHDIYSLFFIGWLIGGLTFVIGGIWANQMRKRFLKDPNLYPEYLFSHFCYQVGSLLWLAFGIWGVVLPIFIFTGKFLGIVSTITLIIWSIKRFIKGYRALNRQEALQNPFRFY